MYDNTNWIRAGESEDKHALVVVSDIAKYDLGSSGEMTQGGGAIAMLLNDEPRLLEFDPKVTSTSIKNEYDFYRPFGKETPIVHGQYSKLTISHSSKKCIKRLQEKSYQNRTDRNERRRKYAGSYRLFQHAFTI